MHSKSYFAEHATDQKIRERYFPDFARMGVMVEVGGGTPEFLSMSKHFKDNGWRVVIVEPNPLFASMHRATGNEVVDFLSVDVEGWEIEVMKGLDTTRHSVGVIVLENLMHEASYTEYMRSIHYKLDMKIEYNYVFTAG